MSKDVIATGAPYEFNPEQGKLIGDLGRSMRIVGIVVLAYAIVGIIMMAVLAWQRRVLALDLNTILGLFVGSWAIAGGRSFVNVATTQGNDMSHLMVALGKLRNIFKLMAILIVVALVIAIAVLIFYLVAHPEGSSLTIQGHPVV
jgi:hypothetical protein